MRKLAILGSGGHGKVCANIAEMLGYNVSFFDDAYPSNNICGEWLVEGNKNDLKTRINDFECAFVAIGNNKIRFALQKELETTGLFITNLISPTASVDKRVVLGNGILVAGNAFINIGSIIGDGCIVNTNATIEHDCKLGGFTHISPGVSLAGEVSVGENSWVGIGSSIIQQITIGSNVTVGAGSVVIKDIHNNATVVGCPARIIK